MLLNVHTATPRRIGTHIPANSLLRSRGKPSGPLNSPHPTRPWSLLSPLTTTLIPVVVAACRLRGAAHRTMNPTDGTNTFIRCKTDANVFIHIIVAGHGK